MWILHERVENRCTVLKYSDNRKIKERGKNMEVYCNIRFSDNGKVFEERCIRILKIVEETGSLNKAAKELDLPYCTAFRAIRKIEKEFGFTLLKRRTGGSAGGGSSLTLRGKAFMERYKPFSDELTEAVRAVREKYFGADNGIAP
jgi:molybdate transport system regulatory protein